MKCAICFTSFLGLLLSAEADRPIVNNGIGAITEYSPDISLVEFQSLLYSEINSEIETALQQEQQGAAPIEEPPASVSSDHQDHRLRGRFLREEDVVLEAQEAWDKVVRHGWEMSASQQSFFKTFYNKPENELVRNLLQANSDDNESQISISSPFLVCSHSSRNTSGYQRLESMLKLTGAHLGDFTVVRNDPEKTCYHVALKHEAAQELRESIMISRNRKNNDGDDDYYTLVPMTDLMKIQLDTMNFIFEDSWSIPTASTPNDWERTVRVGLSTGHRVNLNKDGVLAIATGIIDDIRSLGETGAKNRRRRRLQGKEDSKDYISRKSLSDLFSLTSSNKQNDKQDSRYLRNSHERIARTSPHWSRALELGLEADHSCHTMFKTLDFNVHFDNEGFDIVLNPSKSNHDRIEKRDNKENEEMNDGIESLNLGGSEIQCKNGIECSSSASNKHCVSSLVMALSTHPLVLSVESEGPILTNDYEAQWITQSRTVGKRPLRDIGINGKNEIISIIDSGLDINHKYFGPTNARVYDEWDHSQRKVVRYDHSVGDKVEPKGGHGTKVAGAAAGSAQDSDDEANGAAEGAKLHVFDIQQGTGWYKMPSAYTFFESMHSTDKTPARIANGSWSTKYRPYPFSCKFFDDALYGDFQGDLYIASAGNQGLDEETNPIQSKERTIGNPASCKNTLAVGASQSHGQRLTAGDKGMDYLAAFSSRGPTYDGRMKPDLVAPGASVLTAYAQETDRTVQSYGTSFSGPIIAGNAALVRQYFKEGNLPCTWAANCGFDPSGSLVKAVLLNSAQKLKQIQVSKPWLNKKILEEVSEYDNNQGMGLIQLDKTLPIAGHNKFSAIIRNNKTIKDQEFINIYIQSTPRKCFNTSYSRDFSATLTWYDPAGASSCAKCLVNDLDIMVHWVTSSGKIKYNSKVFPNGATHKDYENNVERVRFEMQGGRRYRIRIQAANLATAETKFSMIATGCFKVIRDPAL